MDVDYWSNPNVAEKSLTSLLKAATKKRIPMLAVMNHQQLLSDVNDSGAQRLVNVDEHSDLVDADCEDLNCGTWVSYVRWRRQGKYLWLRNRDRLTIGNCNRGKPRWNSGSDWGKTETRYPGKSLRLLPLLRDCVGVGLCLSPEFSNEKIHVVFRELIDQFRIPYKKGRISESNVSRKLRPPNRK
jgi:hypothetical protein